MTIFFRVQAAALIAVQWSQKPDHLLTSCQIVRLFGFGFGLGFGSWTFFFFVGSGSCTLLAPRSCVLVLVDLVPRDPGCRIKTSLLTFHWLSKRSPLAPVFGSGRCQGGRVGGGTITYVKCGHSLAFTGKMASGGRRLDAMKWLRKIPSLLSGWRCGGSWEPGLSMSPKNINLMFFLPFY